MSNCFIYDNINAVIHVVLPFINGGLFDAFEYYTGIYEYDKDIYLLYINYPDFNYSYITNKISPLILKNIFRDKYNISPDALNHVIFVKKPSELIRYKFNKVLILDNHTLYYMKPFLNMKECHVIIDPFNPSKTDYHKLASLPNYQCYSELSLYMKEQDK